METDVLVNLGSTAAVIGVMIALNVRLDKRIDAVDRRGDRMDAKFDAMDAKFDSKLDRMDAKFEGKLDSMVRDLSDVKVVVARIEGFIESRYGFGRVRKTPDVPEPDVEGPAAKYREAG